MKNFKIAMILVAAVAFFCSCGGDPEKPTASFVDANGQNEMTFDLATATSVDVDITLSASDAKGLTAISVTRTNYDANDEVLGTPVEYEIPAADFDGKTDYSGKITETLAKADVEGAAKVVYEAVVTNKKEAQEKATYTVNVVAPAFTEGTFEWVRQGSNKTGLDTFGLYWDTNAKVKAVIKPLEGAKLYILTPADYAATSVSALNLTTEATQYYSVSCDASGDYDDVIATVYNGKTYLMHVTKGKVETGVKAVRVTITGDYKAFDTTPVAAK